MSCLYVLISLLYSLITYSETKVCKIKRVFNLLNVIMQSRTTLG